MVKAAAQAKAGTNTTGIRISENDYKGIALALRQSKLEPTKQNIAHYGTLVMHRSLTVSQVSENRVKQVAEFMRAQDAADADVAKAQLAGSIGGLKNKDVADLAIKAIVTNAINTAVLATEQRLLAGTRQLLMAQEARLRGTIVEQRKFIEAICIELNIPIPPLSEPEVLPMITAEGRIARAPRILIYGMQNNQKQPVYDKIKEWGLKDVATVDIGMSVESVNTMKKGYDVVIINRHYVGVDAVRALTEHGEKIVQAAGAMSDVCKHLQAELLQFAIEKKRNEVKS